MNQNEIGYVPEHDDKQRWNLSNSLEKKKELQLANFNIWFKCQFPHYICDPFVSCFSLKSLVEKNMDCL